jgi:hypothetical protein
MAEPERSPSIIDESESPAKIVPSLHPLWVRLLNRRIALRARASPPRTGKP